MDALRKFEGTKKAKSDAFPFVSSKIATLMNSDLDLFCNLNPRVRLHYPGPYYTSDIASSMSSEFDILVNQHNHATPFRTFVRDCLYFISPYFSLDHAKAVI